MADRGRPAAIFLTLLEINRGAKKTTRRAKQSSQGCGRFSVSGGSSVDSRDPLHVDGGHADLRRSWRNGKVGEAERATTAWPGLTRQVRSGPVPCLCFAHYRVMTVRRPAAIRLIVTRRPTSRCLFSLYIPRPFLSLSCASPRAAGLKSNLAEELQPHRSHSARRTSLASDKTLHKAREKKTRRESLQLTAMTSRLQITITSNFAHLYICR